MHTGTPAHRPRTLPTSFVLARALPGAPGLRTLQLDPGPCDGTNPAPARKVSRTGPPSPTTRSHRVRSARPLDKQDQDPHGCGFVGDGSGAHGASSWPTSLICAVCVGA